MLSQQLEQFWKWIVQSSKFEQFPQYDIWYIIYPRGKKSLHSRDTWRITTHSAVLPVHTSGALQWISIGLTWVISLPAGARDQFKIRKIKMINVQIHINRGFCQIIDFFVFDFSSSSRFKFYTFNVKSLSDLYCTSHTVWLSYELKCPS